MIKNVETVISEIQELYEFYSDDYTDILENLIEEINDNDEYDISYEDGKLIIQSNDGNFVFTLNATHNKIDLNINEPSLYIDEIYNKYKDIVSTIHRGVVEYLYRKFAEQEVPQLDINNNITTASKINEIHNTQNINFLTYISSSLNTRVEQNININEDNILKIISEGSSYDVYDKYSIDEKVIKNIVFEESGIDESLEYLNLTYKTNDSEFIFDGESYSFRTPLNRDKENAITNILRIISEQQPNNLDFKRIIENDYEYNLPQLFSLDCDDCSIEYDRSNDWRLLFDVRDDNGNVLLSLNTEESNMIINSENNIAFGAYSIPSDFVKSVGNVYMYLSEDEDGSNIEVLLDMVEFDSGYSDVSVNFNVPNYGTIGIYNNSSKKTIEINDNNGKYIKNILDGALPHIDEISYISINKAITIKKTSTMFNYQDFIDDFNIVSIDHSGKLLKLLSTGNIDISTSDMSAKILESIC